MGRGLLHEAGTEPAKIVRSTRMQPGVGNAAANLTILNVCPLKGEDFFSAWGVIRATSARTVHQPRRLQGPVLSNHCGGAPPRLAPTG